MTEQLILKIEGVAYGGKGVARSEGKVWFVAGGVPGDVVRARPVQEKKQYGEAEVIAVEDPSPLRERAPCPHFGECGGCLWQDIPYDVQLEWKRQFVNNALKRIGQLREGVDCEIVGSANSHGWRSRFTFQASLDPSAGWRIGFHRPRSHEIIDLETCTVAEPIIDEFIRSVKKLRFPVDAHLKFRLECQRVEVEDKIGLTVVIHTKTRSEADRLTKLCALLEREIPSVCHCSLALAVPKDDYYVYDRDDGVIYLTAPSQFQQANLSLNRLVREQVHGAILTRGHQRVLDVFCGSGNLSLGLARSCNYVEGVEMNAVAIGAARQAVEHMGFANAIYLNGDAEKHLWKCARNEERFDAIIVDPPREGMYKAMVPLKKLAADTIVYLSCNPTTLARDLSYLFRNEEYELRHLTAYDFFPHTFHVETLAILERKT